MPSPAATSGEETNKGGNEGCGRLSLPLTHVFITPLGCNRLFTGPTRAEMSLSGSVAANTKTAVFAAVVAKPRSARRDREYPKYAFERLPRNEVEAAQAEQGFKSRLAPFLLFAVASTITGAACGGAGGFMLGGPLGSAAGGLLGAAAGAVLHRASASGPQQV